MAEPILPRSDISFKCFDLVKYADPYKACYKLYTQVLGVIRVYKCFSRFTGRFGHCSESNQIWATASGLGFGGRRDRNLRDEVRRLGFSFFRAVFRISKALRTHVVRRKDHTIM